MPRIARLLLALLLLLGSAPAWSMQGPRRLGAGGLACLRLCARASALLSEGGRLPLLGAPACRASLRQAPEALPAQPAGATAAPGLAGACPPPAAAEGPAAPGVPARAGRAPPPPPAFLASSQPSAQAPPAPL